MPSQRRVRLLFIAIVAGVVLTLFWTSHLRAHQERDSRTIQDFYHKTVQAMNNKKVPGQTVLDSTTGNGVNLASSDRDADGDVDADDELLAMEMSERLKAAEQKAKDLANQKSPLKPDPPSEVIGIGSSAGGQKKEDKAAEASENPRQEETEEEHNVEVELNSILKKSPVIIFSKTYCRFSKRAKGILLEKYAIDPPPYVVELDEHPLGPQLQARLAEKTGRKTVPNIMINGVSIGGSDEIADLDKKNGLVDKIKDLGNKRVEVKERSA